jgi:hypothetical protein
MNISKPALRRLQVLYGQYEAHSLDCGPRREGRLAWASQQTGRTITSFSNLTVEEGIRLIDGLQRAVGHKVPSKTPRRRMGRTQAEKAGTEGRRDQIHDETTMVSPADLERIRKQLDRLGWDQAGLEHFLRSPKSPTQGRVQILTLRDANRVYWGLKRIKPRKEQLAS